MPLVVPPLSMFPIPPPKRTASAVTTPRWALCEVSSTRLYSLDPLSKSNVPRYTHVPPPICWLTLNVVFSPLCHTVYEASSTLFFTV